MSELLIMHTVLCIEVWCLEGLGSWLVIICVTREHGQGNEVPVVSAVGMASELLAELLFLLHPQSD